MLLAQYWTNRLTVEAEAATIVHNGPIEEKVESVVRNARIKRTTPVVTLKTRIVQV